MVFMTALLDHMDEFIEVKRVIRLGLNRRVLTGGSRTFFGLARRLIGRGIG